MEDYKALVKRLADQKSSETIPNASISHAAVVIENLFSHADKSIRIFTGELNKEVYSLSAVREAAKDFLAKRAGTLEILIQNLLGAGDISEHQLIRDCLENSNCKVQYVTDENDKKINCHFIVADGRAWRFEPDKNTFEAIACFNDQDSAKKLESIFNTIFPRAKELVLNT